MVRVSGTREPVKGLYISRKFFGLISVFIILGLVLAGMLVVATNMLSGLRAYSTMQTYWTESRKDATFELIRYLETGDLQHLDHFDDALEIIRDARFVRDELMSDSPDYDFVRQKLLAIHTQPRDVSQMIRTFESLHALDHLSDAVRLWEESNQTISEMEKLAGHLRETAGENRDEASVNQYMDRVWELDNILRNHKDTVTASMSEGTRLVRNIIIWLGISLCGLLLVSGSWLSYRFLNRIKTWATVLDISEQRYRSLFDQNPNAVFSVDRSGKIISGNDTFVRLSGYLEHELEQMDFRTLSIEEELENIDSRMEKVLNGYSQSFETRWKRTSGEELILHMTALPMRVDNHIEGVFIIAEDISFQKYAEEKIKSQLQEKISLLEEVHDRVKNNLALMSSLLQLQDQYIEDEKSRKSFESAVSRIRSIALVHERLYQSDNFANIRIDDFIKDLASTYKNTFQKEDSGLNIHFDMQPVKLNIKQAVPCGLLINEIVMNAFKHAFKGREYGRIDIHLSEANGNIRIKISDDGDGLAEDFDPDNQTTLGMTLIQTLSAQLNAQIRIHGKDGTEVEIEFRNTLDESSARLNRHPDYHPAIS